MSQHSPVLSPAKICWRDNTPYSLDFGDYYYSKKNGVEESDYVFIQGNKLLERWQQFEDEHLSRFSIFETGFGSGLNFLLTAEHWLDFKREHKPEHLNKLSYTSVEIHPLQLDDLIKIIRNWSVEFTYTNQLITYYPPAIKGIYHFDFGRIELKLILMPLDQALSIIEPKGRPLFDCLFLDGFTPSRNKSMWESALLRRLSYFCKQDSTFSTFTAASRVRKDLIHSGYTIKKVKGFGSKREMLTGVLSHSNIPTYKSKYPWFETKHTTSITEPIIIIGAGIAGCATAHALAKENIQSIIIDSEASIGGTIADFNYSSFSPYISADFNPVSQFYWAAYSLLQHYLFQHDDVIHDFCGVFLTANNQERFTALNAAYQLLKRSGLEIEWIKKDQTLTTTGIEINHPGLFVKQAGWLNLRSMCKSLINSPLISTQLATQVLNIKKHHNHWQVESTNGIFEGSHVIFCTGANSNLLDDYKLCRLDKIKGQVTTIQSPEKLGNLKTIINNGHYLIPAHQSKELITGSNYDRSNLATNCATIEADIKNLTALKGLSEDIDNIIKTETQLLSNLETSNSSKGIRLSSRDHLPLIGPIPDMSFYQKHYPEYIKTGRLKGCPNPKYFDGLFINTAHGSRGITASLLAGEIIASLLADKQLPLPTQLFHSVHPARFFVRDCIN